MSSPLPKTGRRTRPVSGSSMKTRRTILSPLPPASWSSIRERLAKHFPDDKERPPYPKWIEKSETHDERISSERAAMFPLLLMSNHGRWRTHAQCDDISWTRETPTCKVLGADGYRYEPVWINPEGCRKARHQGRRYRQGIQRERCRPLRRPGLGTNYARRRLCGPWRPP